METTWASSRSGAGPTWCSICQFSLLRQEKIASEPIELRFKTRIDLALALARDKLFTNEAGDRPYIPDVLIVFTDGKHGGSDKSFDFKAFVDNINKTFKVGDSVSYVVVYKS